MLDAKKILIIGDSARGKTTFAQKLADITGIPLYSLDDFIWKHKYTERNTDEYIWQQIEHVSKQPTWILEGATRYFLKTKFIDSDIIFNFAFKNVFQQLFYIFIRYTRRKNETLISLLRLYKTVLTKRYFPDAEDTREDMLKAHSHKVIDFYSFKDIDDYLKDLPH